MTDNEEKFTLNAESKEIAWEVNALLTALHEESLDIYESILAQSDNPAGLLVMATATLKSMLDIVIEMANESVPEGEEITFNKMIQLTAESLLDTPDGD